MISLESTAYLLEPLQSLGRELVLLAVLFEVSDQLGEDALELLQSGGHVDGSAGQVGVGNRYALTERCDWRVWLVRLYRSRKWSREPMEALKSDEQRNGGQRRSSCVYRTSDLLAAPEKHSLSIHRTRAVRVEASGTSRLVQGHYVDR